MAGSPPQSLGMRSTDGLSEDSLAYLHDKHVPELLEYLLRSLLRDKPVQPLPYLHELTAKPLPPHIMIAGPPASGKGTQCQHICAFFKRKYAEAGLPGRKPVHISSGDLLREQIEKGTNLGKVAEGYMKEGKLVPDTLIISMIRHRLEEEDAVLNGWLLDGFPRNKDQAVALDAEGFAPDIFLLLEVPDEALVERVEGRRIDPATGNSYHLKYSPPPEDDQALCDRLVQRADDTREALVPRLEAYHKFTDAIVSFYAPVTVRVDANRPELAVSDAVTAALESKRLL